MMAGSGFADSSMNERVMEKEKGKGKGKGREGHGNGRGDRDVEGDGDGGGDGEGTIYLGGVAWVGDYWLIN